MYRHASERSQVPNINTALDNTSYVPTPTATPNSSVNLSRFPSTSTQTSTTTTTTTATAASRNSGKSSSGSSNPGAVRVVTLLSALGPALGPVSPRLQAPFQSPAPSPAFNPPARVRQTQEVEVSPPMAGSIASPKKTHFLDRFSGSPSLGSGTSSTASSATQSKTAVRMVGRGGSGSKPRSVKLEPSIPDVTPVKSDTSSATSSKNGKVRYVGRGGQGSRHKLAKEEGDEDDEPGPVLKLPWKKIKKAKSKMTMNSGKESSINSEEYDYYLRPTPNASRSTLTSSNPPSGGHDFAAVSVTSLDSFGFEPYGTSLTARRNVSNSKSADASLNKVAKQMGELPPHLIYQQLLNDRRGPTNSEALPPRLDTQNLGHRRTPSAPMSSISVSEERTPTSTQRHVANTLSSLGSPSAYSLTPSFETSTSCELHRFGLADDMSDTWGEVRDNGDKHNCYSDNTGLEDDYEAPSPIMFSPPTPIDRKKGVARCTVCHIETGLELEQDAVSEFSVALSDAESGIGSTARGNGDETTDSTLSLPADKSNSTASSPVCHVHPVTGLAVRALRSNYAALDSPETRAGTHSHSHLGSAPTQSARSQDGRWRTGEGEGELKTPVVERGHGPAFFRSLVDEKVKVESPSSSVCSLSSAEALSGHPVTTSSCSTTPPESASFATSMDNVSFDFESKYLPPLPSPAPSTTSFASSISSASSLPYASTPSSEPSKSRPETPFGNFTRLRVPSSSTRPGTAGSMSSTASNSTANSATSSSPAVGAKRHLGQARRLSISADSFEEDVVVLVGGQSRRRRSVNWGAGSVGLGAPASAEREETPTAPLSVEVEVQVGHGKKRGKKQRKEPEVWTGEWNTGMGDVIKALRML